MKNVEILAPAGSIEGLYGALKIGADAVYVGTSSFSARAFANNPSVDELNEALTYAHLRDKKIYLTVNTLLNNQEIEKELFLLIAPLYENGLDACIVQDMGVLSFLHQNFPDMDLHASTQMTLLSGKEANVLKQFGVSRFVPARELTIEEIKRARKETDLEIEVFVHGALCYCYSGQCLMSEVIGGRSGNRGMCAQPCRLVFENKYGKNHFLSTKDMCTLEYIPELIEAGIDSFKIEGRMKRKEYAGGIAYLYKKYRDIYLEEGKSYYKELVENKESQLWKDYKKAMDLYNRGGFFDSWLFEKNKKNAIYEKKNNHYGLLVGKVISSNNRSAKIKLLEDINYQDVLEFRDRNKEKAYEYTVKNPARAGEIVTTNIMKGSNIYSNQEVYRTKNTHLLEKICEKIDASNDRIGLEARVEVKLGQRVKLSIKGKNIEVETYGDLVEKALKKAITAAEIKEKIDKLGNEKYYFSDFKIEVDDNVFLPLGGLKKLRREGIRNWQESATNKRKIKEDLIILNKNNEIKEDINTGNRENRLKIISVFNKEQAMAAAQTSKEDVIIHLELDGLTAEEWNDYKAILSARKIAVSFPRILHGHGLEVFEKEWKLNNDFINGIDCFLINSFMMYDMCKDLNVKMIADDNFYQTNNWAIKTHEKLNICLNIPLLYGRRPLMYSKACLFKTCNACKKEYENSTSDLMELKLADNNTFLVLNRCQYCYNIIFNKEVIDGPDNEKEVFGRLSFTFEDAQEVRRIIRKWNF